MPTTSAPPPQAKRGRPKVYSQERRVLGVNLVVADIEEAREMLGKLGISFSAYMSALLSEDLKARRVGTVPDRR